MAEVRVILSNQLGLHARAAGKVVNIAAKSNSRVEIERPSKRLKADARSILEILSLGAKCGSTLVLRSENEEGEEIVRELVDLIESGFGEV